MRVARFRCRWQANMVDLTAPSPGVRLSSGVILCFDNARSRGHLLMTRSLRFITSCEHLIHRHGKARCALRLCAPVSFKVA